jgi:hypothetical protein
MATHLVSHTALNIKPEPIPVKNHRMETQDSLWLIAAAMIIGFHQAVFLLIQWLWGFAVPAFPYLC